MGLISMPRSRSLSPCLKNSSMIRSVHCRYNSRGFVGLLKSAQWTMFRRTCLGWKRKASQSCSTSSSHQFSKPHLEGKPSGKSCRFSRMVLLCTGSPRSDKSRKWLYSMRHWGLGLKILTVRHFVLTSSLEENVTANLLSEILVTNVQCLQEVLQFYN